MSIGKKKRFDVFKRDSFTCAYCGQKPPNVILQVDHIIPSSKGGPDDTDNLITACADCNQGKGAGMLTDIPESLAQRHEKMAEQAEQAEQLEEYNKFLLRQRREKDKAIRELGYHWFNHFMPDNQYVFGPDRVASIRTFLDRLPQAEILDAMDKALSRIPVRGEWDEKAWKYFCGICWNKIKSAGS